jgi:glycosyltransferase involved in cell wall biosynthesis
MRFTILTQYYPPEVGAAQVRLLAFAAALQKKGHTVQVVTAMPNYPSGVIQPSYRGKIWHREVMHDVPLIRTWIYPATGRNVLKRLLNYFSFTVSSVPALLLVPRADVVFVESPPLFLCLSGWLASVLRRQRLCLNISDLWPDSVVALGIMQEGAFVNMARKLEKWLYKRSWRVCGVTHGVKQGIVSKGVPAEKVLFLPNGVDTNLFKSLPTPSSKPCKFLYAGTHGYAHGVEVILRAADLLREHDGVQFVLVGDGADKPRLQALAQSMKLPNVIFKDAVPVTSMPELLASAYAALVTVKGGEFFSGTRSAKLFPAMAAGRAILHSGAGEGANLVERERCGIVTPPEDSVALANAVRRMIVSYTETSEMGKRGRELVEREYSWSAIVEKWLKEL